MFSNFVVAWHPSQLPKQEEGLFFPLRGGKMGQHIRQTKYEGIYKTKILVYYVFYSIPYLVLDILPLYTHYLEYLLHGMISGQTMGEWKNITQNICVTRVWTYWKQKPDVRNTIDFSVNVVWPVAVQSGWWLSQYIMRGVGSRNEMQRNKEFILLFKNAFIIK